MLVICAAPVIKTHSQYTHKYLCKLELKGLIDLTFMNENVNRKIWSCLVTSPNAHASTVSCETS